MGAGPPGPASDSGAEELSHPPLNRIGMKKMSATVTGHLPIKSETVRDLTPGETAYGRGDPSSGMQVFLERFAAMMNGALKPAGKSPSSSG